MQNAILIKIFNLTAKKEIVWSKVEQKAIDCNRFEGEHKTCEFVIMEMKDYESYVGYKEKDKRNFTTIDASQKDIDMFIKIIKATKIKEKVLA
jgi:hypothetical protein